MRVDNLPECMEFLKEAVVKDEKYKLTALEDDLKGVREVLIELGWGKVVV